MLATSQSAVKGRWGWHSVDYPTFVLFKKLHKLLLRDLRATRRSERWHAKLPHNRVRRSRDGTVTPIPEPVALGTDRQEYEWVLSEYRDLRRPADSPEAVPQFSPPKKWRERLAQLEEFYPE